MKILEIGARYGKLVVAGPGVPARRGERCLSSTSVCVCDCGNTKTIQNTYLRSGDTKSCGCLSAESAAKRMTKHGRCGTPEYVSWMAMITRCTNPNQPHWKNYGGRGITVCERWRNSFEAFLEDMGEMSDKNMSIDRFPDKNGNYEQGNCRWATDKEQALNRRGNVRLTFYGKEMSLQAWASISHVKPNVIIQRLRLGWPEKDAVWTVTRKGQVFTGVRGPRKTTASSV